MTSGWATVEIAGKAALIHQPPAATRSGVVCLADNVEPALKHSPFRSMVESSRRLWVFPFEEAAWWSDLPHAAFPLAPSPESWLRDDVPAWLESRLGEGARTAWLGFGFGGQTALKLAFDDPLKFPLVAAFEPDIDVHEQFAGSSLEALYPNAEAVRQRSAILRVHPPGPETLWILSNEAGETHRATQRLVEKLRATGVQHTYSPFDGTTWITLREGPLWENVAQFLASHLDRPPRLPMAG